MNNEKTTILVVDDSDTQRQFLTYILRNEKYQVIEAKDGLQGLNTAREKKPELIITDILMPTMDGYELISNLKQDKSLENIQIILYTAEYQEQEAISFGKIFGINHYLNKPTEKDELLKTVVHALHEKTHRSKLVNPEEISKKHLDLVNSKLYKQVHDLEKLKQDLDARIAERTKELETLNQKLRDDSIHDPLTGLYNRRYLDDAIEREISRSDRNQKSFAVVMLDIDFFKKTNDEYGHLAGDIVLHRLAKILKNNMRKLDFVCRYGGEEFIIILVGIEEKEVFGKLENIRTEIEQLEIIALENKIKSTVSMGFCIYPAQKKTVGTLIDAADHALYQAKKEGRNCIRQYSLSLEK